MRFYAGSIELLVVSKVVPQIALRPENCLMLLAYSAYSI